MFLAVSLWRGSLSLSLSSSSLCVDFVFVCVCVCVCIFLSFVVVVFGYRGVHTFSRILVNSVNVCLRMSRSVIFINLRRTHVLMWLVVYVFVAHTYICTCRLGEIRHDHYVAAVAGMEMGLLYLDQGMLDLAEKQLSLAKYAHTHTHTHTHTHRYTDTQNHLCPLQLELSSDFISLFCCVSVCVAAMLVKSVSIDFLPMQA